ncbi:hypothetical protein [Rhizobium sp. CF142]|uniref:hypothetical protein n=1 Tax=Rhizobium sp. CF142 TaxID=1144314 RepID=UPI00138B167C|nr:hypothetical protein [Rhizobium sp. CF142]
MKFIALAAGVAFVASGAVAADYGNKPFTLAYDGAITENVAGEDATHSKLAGYPSTWTAPWAS